MNIPTARNYNYDLIKFLAIFAMIIDHIGVYFLPEVQTFRLIGRAAAPIFCFLIGFSNSKKTDFSFLAIGVAIIVMDFILTGYYEPNILISLFCLRFCNNIFTDKDFLLKRFHIISIIALTFITLHVFDIFEYSSAVILCYIFGHLVRLNSKNINFFGFIFPLIYYFYVNSFVHFTFSPLLTFSYIFLTFAIMAKLEFKPYPMKKKLSSKIIYFFGKYAFQIYFLHYTMFLLISYLYF